MRISKKYNLINTKIFYNNNMKNIYIYEYNNKKKIFIKFFKYYIIFKKVLN